MSASLLRNGTFALTIKVLAAAASYGMFIALSRWLGPVTYGRYAAAFSAGTFLSFAMLAGLNTDILRSLPVLVKAGDGEALRARIGGTLRALGLSAGGIAAAGLALALLAGALGRPEGMVMALCALGFGLAIAMSEFLVAMFRSLGAVKLALIPRDILWRLLVIGAALALALAGIEASLPFAAGLSVLMLLAALGAQLAAGRRLIPQAKDPLPPLPSARQLLYQSRWLAVAAVVSNLLNPLAVVVVGFSLSYTDSGLYFTAQKTAALLLLPLIAMNMMGAPQIAIGWREGNLEAVQKTCRQIVAASSVVTLVGFVVIAVLAGPLLSIFDVSYRDEGMLLVILALGSLVNSLAGPTLNLLAMTGHELAMIVVVVLGQGLGLALVTLGALTWGLHGAAVGEVMGVVLVNGMATIWARANMRVDPSALSLLRREAR